MTILRKPAKGGTFDNDAFFEKQKGVPSEKGSPFLTFAFSALKVKTENNTFLKTKATQNAH